MTYIELKNCFILEKIFENSNTNIHYSYYDKETILTGGVFRKYGQNQR